MTPWSCSALSASLCRYCCFLGNSNTENTHTSCFPPSRKGRCDIMIIFPSVLLCHLDYKLSKRHKTEKTSLTMTRLYAARNEAAGLKIPFKKEVNKTSGCRLPWDADRETAATMRLGLLSAVNKQKSGRAKNGWLRCTAEEASPSPSLSLSPSLPLHLSLCVWQNSTIYLFQKSVSGNHLIFIASFDSNDFMKPLILARSPWLQHRRVPLLISDSISSEQCTAVAPDTYMPPTLKCAGNLFSPRCSSSWCNSHSDKNPSLWYLATKWEDGQREGSLVVGGGFGWSHIFVITIRRERMVTRQVPNIQN